MLGIAGLAYGGWRVVVAFIGIDIRILHLRVADNALLLINYMHQIGTVLVFVTQHPKYIINDTGGVFNIGVPYYHTGRLKAGKGEFLHVFL